MGAELVEQSDILSWNVCQTLEQPRNEAVIGRGPRQIGEANANPILRLDPLPQRRRADWVFQRGQHRRTLVRHAGIVRRLDHGCLRLWQIDRQVTLAIGYFAAVWRPSLMHQRALWVRIKIAPSDTAGELIVGSPRELVASTSNFGLALSTNASPDWFTT